ncbi:hypothetical protein VNO78_02611 [Psophocarpus tetragonolobus]|uniref:Uncharacterized protein n=1 Tax=Psophocarpus tetragonolobus TaxID=3891 RepID=A0AAN9XW55_PSOTE
MNQMSSSLESHWSNRCNEPRKRDAFCQSKADALFHRHEGQKRDAFCQSKVDTGPTSCSNGSLTKEWKGRTEPEQVGLGYRAVTAVGVTEDVLVRFKEGYD